MIAKSAVQVEVFIGGNSNFQLILCPRVSNYFPVVYSTGESNVSHCTSEHIWLFFEENLSAVLLRNYSCTQFHDIPSHLSQRSGLFYHTWFREGSVLEQTFKNFVHFFCISEVRMKLVQSFTNSRTTRLYAFYGLILGFFTIGMVPTLDFETVWFVFFQVLKFNYSGAFGIAAFDIQIIVEPE